MKKNLADFDFEHVARLDAAMWQSYYNHHYMTLFWQLLHLIKTQLGLNWVLTFRLAYYAAWAAADYRLHKKSGTNTERILKNLTHFYRLISAHATKPFNYTKAAELELAWWEIHRKSYSNNSGLEEALAEGAAAIYGVTSASLATYAHNRAEAMMLPRHEGDEQVAPIEWPKIVDLLTIAWGSLHAAVQ